MIARTKALDDRRVDSISPWSYGYISSAGPMLSMSFEEKLERDARVRDLIRRVEGGAVERDRPRSLEWLEGSSDRKASY